MKKRAIICDVDGTVALMKGKRGPFEYAKAFNDEPNIPDIETVLTMKKHLDCKLIMLSARENAKIDHAKYNDVKDLTKAWLDKHVVHYDLLILRDEGNWNDDRYVKYDMYNNYIKNKYNILLVFDDRDRVVNMWRNGLNLTCFQVADGDF